jgi:soluble lytic murein transglycosylase
MSLRIIFFIPFLLAGCFSPEAREDAPLASVSEAVRATPKYQQAKHFDSFLKGELPANEKLSLAEECLQKRAENPFCFTVLREKKIRAFKAREEKALEPHFRQKPEPVTPELAGSKIKGWNTVQKASLKALISGMRAFSLEELKRLGAFALKRPECPNHIAVATAALLEIHLPFENVSSEIASLYEKGAKCTRKRSANHEHYLTRAGLFQFMEKKYLAAEKLLSRVEPVDAYSGRALYWLYRTRKELGKTALAEKTLSKLRTQFPLSFHALLAAGPEAGNAFDGEDTPLPKRSEDSTTNALIEQAERLRDFNFADSASTLAAWALGDYTPRDPALRAYIASLGAPSLQVRTVQGILLTRPASRTSTYYKLAYPKAYFDLFSEFESKVDPYLLLAIARKESTLNPRAVSPANAQGLLQLNPDTARRVSGKESDLFDPKVNAELAARYWEELNEVMKGQLPLMIASYNAGEQTVAHWTTRYPTQDLVLFIDLIPYRETRDYVGFVLANYFWYKRLYSNKASEIFDALSSVKLAKVEEPRGSRTIKSLVDEALHTSESWQEDATDFPASFIHRWKELDVPRDGR